ncbi:MAG: Lrp/AsnC ligand binding domain-containing protein [Nitrososphaerota archaeon]|nr:Lrp/AsnC ligand binding domain-containing protein [Candidatus Calditenuaceae archaeon]MDW8074007.1 Lrp/AsnC ligand binding domain-containing protein [Nitrososphaerota archaeon]
MASGIRAVLHIFVESGKLESVCEQLAKLPETLDVYEVTGEYDVIALVSVSSIEDLRRFISKEVYSVEGVKSSVTSIILHTHKKNGVETWE